MINEFESYTGLTYGTDTDFTTAARPRRRGRLVPPTAGRGAPPRSSVDTNTRISDHALYREALTSGCLTRPWQRGEGQPAGDGSEPVATVRHRDGAEQHAVRVEHSVTVTWGQDRVRAGVGLHPPGLLPVDGPLSAKVV